MTAKNQTNQLINTIGMDLAAPFGIYVNGRLVATYDLFSDAHAHYEQMRQSLREDQAQEK